MVVCSSPALPPRSGFVQRPRSAAKVRATRAAGPLERLVRRADVMVESCPFARCLAGASERIHVTRSSAGTFLVRCTSPRDVLPLLSHERGLPSSSFVLGLLPFPTIINKDLIPYPCLRPICCVGACLGVPHYFTVSEFDLRPVFRSLEFNGKWSKPLWSQLQRDLASSCLYLCQWPGSKKRNLLNFNISYRGLADRNAAHGSRLDLDISAPGSHINNHQAKFNCESNP